MIEILNNILLLLTAIAFFFIGKYSSVKIEKQIIEKTIDKIKPTVKPGLIHIKTEEEIDFEESEEAKDEKQWEKLTKK